MDLIRLDSNPHPNPDKYPDDHRQSEYRVEIIDEYDEPESSTQRVNFPRFGVGEQRRPNFAVEINWIDVRSFVREFIEKGHPEALYLQRMIRLGEAIERAGWLESRRSSVRRFLGYCAATIKLRHGPVVTWHHVERPSTTPALIVHRHQVRSVERTKRT
jgi:hypothetical protein